jgi:hypothetical protein
MTPEQKARVSIDALLQQAGWHVCNVSDANIREVEAEVDANLQRAQALRQSTLATAFAKPTQQ